MLAGYPAGGLLPAAVSFPLLAAALLVDLGGCPLPLAPPHPPGRGAFIVRHGPPRSRFDGPIHILLQVF